jgi:hypothetical protein
MLPVFCSLTLDSTRTIGHVREPELLGRIRRIIRERKYFKVRDRESLRSYQVAAATAPLIEMLARL